jgi:hypothetical protein
MYTNDQLLQEVVQNPICSKLHFVLAPAWVTCPKDHHQWHILYIICLHWLWWHNYSSDEKSTPNHVRQTSLLYKMGLQTAPHTMQMLLWLWTYHFLSLFPLSYLTWFHHLPYHSPMFRVFPLPFVILPLLSWFCCYAFPSAAVFSWWTMTPLELLDFSSFVSNLLACSFTWLMIHLLLLWLTIAQAPLEASSR